MTMILLGTTIRDKSSQTVKENKMLMNEIHQVRYKTT